MWKSALANFFFAGCFYLILHHARYSCYTSLELANITYHHDYMCFPSMLTNRYGISVRVFAIFLLSIMYHSGSAAYDLFFEKSIAISLSMIIHHVVNVILQILAVWCQFHLEFIFVAYLGSITDVPMYLLRGCRRHPYWKEYTKLEHALAAWTWLSWLWHRVYLWGWFLFLLTQYMLNDAQVSYYICFLALATIWILNLYWFFILSLKIFREIFCSQSKSLDRED